MEKKRFSINEASKEYGISTYTLRKMILEGQLKALRPGGKYFITKKELDSVLNGEG